MIALREIRPNFWLSISNLFLAMMSGAFADAWWEIPYATNFTLLGFVLTFPCSVALVLLATYARRPRPEAGAHEDVEIKSGSTWQSTHPPAIAEWLVVLITSKRRAESLLGDLEERFHRHVETRGPRRAHALYWAEVLKSTLPILWAKARSLGLIAAIAEIWRRAHS